MRTVGLLGALATAGLLTTGFGVVVHGQIVRDCRGVDAGCLTSEHPAPGVRVVRAKHYPFRPAHYVSGDLYTTLAAARETRNQFAVVDFFVPPGGGPFPHAHAHEWESFFVVEGTVNFFVDVNPLPPFNVLEQPAGPGTHVYAPKCRVMGFVNRTGAPARILAFAVPAGIDNVFHLVGDEVVDYFAPIPPPTPEQFMRLAFWGEREFMAEAGYIPGGPPPVCGPEVPQKVMTSITDAARPTEIGPFGETRRVLMTPTEVGNITGASAFCGFGPPGRPGGTAQSSYFSLTTSNGSFHSSPNTELFYVLRGSLAFVFEGNRRVHVGPRTYVEIQPGVQFSIETSQKGSSAEALAMSVIAPACPPPF
jgi:mannose-6-phosphate isomerase-like protein (cupin superfamily)